MLHLSLNVLVTESHNKPYGKQCTLGGGFFAKMYGMKQEIYEHIKQL